MPRRAVLEPVVRGSDQRHPAAEQMPERQTAGLGKNQPRVQPMRHQVVRAAQGLGSGMTFCTQRVAQAGIGTIDGLDHIKQARALLTQGLRPLGVVPYIRLLQFAIDLGQPVLLFRVVKDSPAARRNASAGLRSHS